MLTLYYTPHTCALASHIVLEESGAQYATVRIDFAAEEQRRPAYLAINPKGRVPALVTDRGILTETPAILAYVAQRFPAADLAPIDDPFAFAQAQSFNAYICATLHVAHAHRVRGYRWADEETSFEDMRRVTTRSVSACFALIENELLKGPWVMGADYSVCDAYLFTVAQWMEADGVDTALFPRVVDHRRRVSERTAVRRAIAEELA